MDEDELEDTMARAKRTAGKEKMRHPSTFSQRFTIDPGADSEEDMDTTEQEDDLQIWRLLPHLQGLPETMLKKLPLSAMFQLNAAIGKEQKTTAKLTINSRLAETAKKLAAHPTKVEGGVDNRRDKLHKARFLGGTSCAATELWLEARRVVDEKGIPAIGNYDLDSVGCGGSVTPRGWQEIHNPASQELKLKLFYLPNVASSGMSARRVNLDGGEEALSIGDSLKEIADLEGYKAALNTAREALHSALPWNRSISAIVGFMLNTNYLQTDLGGNSRRAAILTEFTDYIFGRNALNWENGAAFLTTDELAHVWSNWRGKRAALFTTRPTEKKEKGGSFVKSPDICRKYNIGKCDKQAEKECKTPFGKVLRHVCNKYTGNGKLCEKTHTRVDHT